jgi:two-component system, NarL family, response regulator DesR
MTRAPLRCLIADDHPVALQGLRAMLDADDEFEIVGEADNGAEAMRLARTRAADIAILDVMMPRKDGLECARELRDLENPPAVVLYTGLGAEALVEEALDAGVRGLLLKDSPSSTVTHALKVVGNGQRYFDGRLSGVLIERVNAGDPLSDREREVLQLLADGGTTTTVAQELFLSPATVRGYAESATRKVGGRNRVEGVANALRAGLIS